MKIHFSPQRSDDALVVDVGDNGLIINSTFYDLSQVQTEGVPSGPIISVTSDEVWLNLPLSLHAPKEALFPEPVEVTSGPVPVPGQVRELNEEGQPIPQSISRYPSEFIEVEISNEDGTTTTELQEVQGELKVVVIENKPTPAPAVPQIVTMRQARLALLGAGKLQMVEAAIDALPEPPKTAAKIEWEYSQEVHRHKPFVQMLAQGLGLSQEELDQLFVVAATL